MGYFKESYCYKIKNALPIGGNQYRYSLFGEGHFELQQARGARVQNHLFKSLPTFYLFP